MLCIVGHGPSVLTGRGALIDGMTVVRLKDGLRKDQPIEHFGTRTDYVCARSQIYSPDWWFNDPPKWVDYYRQYSSKKPSTGLCAVFCAIDKLDVKELALIGFDRMLNPGDEKSGKWHDHERRHFWGHDQPAENQCLHSLGLRIIDLSKESDGNLAGL